MKLQWLLSGLLLLGINAFGGERASQVLIEHQKELIDAATSFGVAPRLLASIIYAEHSLNVKPGEDVLDKVLALSGYNASIGIAQIKVGTARWIRMQLENKTGVFHNPAALALLGNEASKNSVEQISETKVNLMYAAAYVGMILKVWQPLFKQVSHQDKVAGLVAAIYSLGLSRSDGSLRSPHAQAKMNHFGEVAQSFYDSFEMTAEFPQ